MNENITVGLVEEQIQTGIKELEELLPLLGHSQAKKLLLAAMKYPMEEAQFEDESMIKAFSATKRITDGLVALGVETVVEQMVKNHAEMQKQQQEVENVKE